MSQEPINLERRYAEFGHSLSDEEIKCAATAVFNADYEADTSVYEQLSSSDIFAVNVGYLAVAEVAPDTLSAKLTRGERSQIIWGAELSSRVLPGAVDEKIEIIEKEKISLESDPRLDDKKRALLLAALDDKIERTIKCADVSYLGVEPLTIKKAAGALLGELLEGDDQ